MEDRRNPARADRRAAVTSDRRTARPSICSPAQGASWNHLPETEAGSANDSEGAASTRATRRREEANLAREHGVQSRENAASDRETQVLRREGLATSREMEIQGELANQEAMLEHAAKLRQANEQLVISSVKLQAATEEIEKSVSEMTHLANHDYLTDLPNRMQLFDRLTQGIAWARRHHEKLAVLFLDLDRFKTVNDTLGHAIGDQLLQAVARRLKTDIRSSDTVSRQGGDEFVLLLSEVGREEDLNQKIERIHRRVTAPYHVAGHDLEIGATIGISLFPDDGDAAETLISNADSAMYHAKQGGRNHFQFFKETMRTTELEQRSTEASLHRALEIQQFLLMYQAQIDLESGAVIGVEALLRWQHPVRGMLLPASFLPIAENSGAIIPIGRWVLREACRQAQSWVEAGLPFQQIAVNISAREFENDRFVDNVRLALSESGLAADRLELELTETVLMTNLEQTAQTLHALRALGVRVSIDDFGTGYSSLCYLKHFPVDTMKIDKMFVDDIGSGNDEILLNAIIEIGCSLRQRTIAEGVESASQLEFLRKSRCEAVQGFYLNPPMPAGEFTSFLKRSGAQNISHAADK